MPTGTGKTVTLLSFILAYQYKNSEVRQRRVTLHSVLYLGIPSYSAPLPQHIDTAASPTFSARLES